MPELRTRSAVPICKVGTYKLSTGEQTFTRQHLESAARNAADAPQSPRVKIGHTDLRAGFDGLDHDGQPSLGVLRNLRVQNDTLLADIEGVPAWLDDAMSTSFPARSVEGQATDSDLKISALSLLGVTAPGIDTLEDLRHMVAASAPTSNYIFASGQDAEGRDVTVALPPVADTAPAPTPPKEESDMDPKSLREKLGLAEDASVEDVTAALDALTARPEPDSVISADEVDTRVAEAVAAARQEEREKIAASGGTVIDATALAELRAAADDGRKAREVQIAAARAKLVDDTIAAGSVPPARRDHWISQHVKDPEGTEAYLSSLEPGVIPVAASKASGKSPEDSSIDALLAASRARMGHTPKEA